MGFPDYLRRIIDSYLSERVIRFIGYDGGTQKRPTEAGVPQESVLGPVLWNISYNNVLSVADDDENCHILCYADDTLIVATGNNITRTRVRACTVASRVISKIESLGLSVATEKTEATLFYGKRAGNLLDYITINQVCIDLAPSIKYLGVYIDNGWTFTDHFRYIEEKASRVIKTLNRLMPNLGGLMRIVVGYFPT